MKTLSLADLDARADGPVLADAVPGFHIERGGITRYARRCAQPSRGPPRPHRARDVRASCRAPASSRSTGRRPPFQAGDVFVVDAGEDHHLVMPGRPAADLGLDASSARHRMNDPLGGHRVVPVLVLADPAAAQPLADALVAGGLPCAEVTFRTPAAEAVLQTLAADPRPARRRRHGHLARNRSTARSPPAPGSWSRPGSAGRWCTTAATRACRCCPGWRPPPRS